MAPSAGHLHKLVVRNIKLFKHAWHKATHLVKSRISLFPAPGQLQPITIRATGRHPIHPVALLRQSQSRWHSTRSGASARQFGTASGRFTPGTKYNRATFPTSRIGSTVNSLTGRLPFASALRPNLTGGALGRTAGGYSLGSGRIGGVRYFSHTPATQAHVVQNVSQAVRAFWLSGQKAQYDGISRRGDKRYRAVSSEQAAVAHKLQTVPRATPGSYIDFQVNPTITALTPLSIVAGYAKPTARRESFGDETLNTDGLLDILSVDFSRALKDLAIVLNDLKLLAALGDLPITCHGSSTLRVHFPGCDADTVENLCREIGVRRGVVVQDDDFDMFAGTEIALLFPFTSTSDNDETLSDVAEEYELALRLFQPNPPRTPKHAAQGYDVHWQDMLSIPRTITLPSCDDIDYDEEYSTRSETSDVVDGWQGMQGAQAIDAAWPSDDEDHVSGYASEARSWARRSLSTPSGDAPMPTDPLEYHDFEGIYRFIEMCDAARQ